MSFVQCGTESTLEESVAIDLIHECSTTEGDKPDDWDPVATHINLRESFSCAETLKKYPIDGKSIQIIGSFGKTSPDDWDGDFNAWVVFKYDRGYGIAQDTGWWSPTFRGDTYELDVCETDDYDKFDRLCLTDEIRLKLKEQKEK